MERSVKTPGTASFAEAPENPGRAIRGTVMLALLLALACCLRVAAVDTPPHSWTAGTISVGSSEAHHTLGGDIFAGSHASGIYAGQDCKVSSWATGWIVNSETGGHVNGALGGGSMLSGTLVVKSGGQAADTGTNSLSMNGTMTVNGGGSASGNSLWIGNGDGGAGALNVGGNVTSSSIWTAGTTTVTGTINNTTNNVLDMTITGTGVGGSVTTSADNTVRQDLEINQDGSLSVGGDNKVTRHITVSGRGEMEVAGDNTVTNGNVTIGNLGSMEVTGTNTVSGTGTNGNVVISGDGELIATNNIISKNVTLSDNASFTSTTMTGNTIGGNLTMTNNSQISGYHDISGYAHISGTGTVHTSQTADEEIIVSDTRTLANNVELKSNNMYVQLNGTDDSARILAQGNNKLEANTWVSVTNTQAIGTMDIIAGTDVRINDQNKITSNNTSFEGDTTINAGQNVTINTGNTGNTLNVANGSDFTVNAGGSVELNNGAGNDTALFSGETQIHANGGDLDVNIGAGTDRVSFDDEATFTASGDITINDGNAAGDNKTIIFDDAATITAGGGIDLNTGAGDDRATFVGVTNITANGDDLNVNTGGGTDHVAFDDAATLTTSGDLSINTGTGDKTIIFDANATLDAVGDVTINKSGGNDKAQFQGTTSIDSSAGDVTVNSAEFVGNATITAGQGTVTVQSGTDLGTGSFVAGKNTVISDSESTSHLTVGEDANPANFTSDTVLISDSTIGGTNNKIIAKNDVTIEGSSISSGNAAATWTTITSTTGDITIRESSKAGNAGSYIDSDTHIDSAKHLTITGHDTTNRTILGDRVIAEADGNMTLTNITVGAGGDIFTTGGHVVITDVISDSTIRSTGTDGGGHNNWTLQGSTTDIRNTIELNGDEDRVTVLDGKYKHIENETGDLYLDYRNGKTELVENIAAGGEMVIDFTGGQIKTIDNSAAGVGDSYITLLGHNNAQEDPNTPPLLKQGQSIEELVGNTAALDTLVVDSGVRFTEYLDPAHNYDNAVPPAFGGALEPGRFPITNQITSITDYDRVVLNSGNAANRTGLEIGTRIDPTGAFLQAEEIEVRNYADLFIHGDLATVHESDRISVGDHSNLWLDRTTIAGMGGVGNDTYVTVTGTGSRIVGYMERDAFTGDFLGSGYNIIGDLGVATGGTIQVYDVNYYDGLFMDQRYCTQDGSWKLPLFNEAKSQNGEGMSVSGDLAMAGNAALKVRIFTKEDDYHQTGIKDYDKDDNFLGTYTTMNVNSSDFVSVDGTATFGGSALLDVTFGNDNELTAKIGDRYGMGPANEGFKLYTGEGSTHDNSYYYSVVRSGADIELGAIASGTNIGDNWVLGNNLNIVKSDMLGTWDTMISEDGKDVILRFRLLAKHPVDGGIAADMHEPNAEAAAKQIDRIRYPFDHGDMHVRYDGDMVDYYSKNGNLFPNYKYEYIMDWENLLREIQKTIESGGTLHTAMRKLHPEPYADLANLNFGLMDQFHQVREQHGISALFQVEKQIQDNVQAGIDGNTAAYASVNDEYCGDYYYSQFVDNPVRFWASPFGSDGRQKKVGTEYGYDSEVWGAAFGVTKEWGDFYAGLSAGYARATTTWTDLDASAKTDAYMADAVLGYRRGMGFFEAFGSYAYDEHSVRRYIGIGGYTGTGKGEYHDNVWTAGIRMGYQQVFCDSFLFVPTIGVNYIQTESGAFTEKGNSGQATLLDFAKGGIKRHNVRVPVMGRISKPFAICDYIVTPEVRGGFTAYFGDKRAKATTRFVGDPGPSSQGRFSAVGLETGRWAAQVGASVELSKRGRFTLTGNYDLVMSKKRMDHHYSLMMGLNF